VRLIRRRFSRKLGKGIEGTHATFVFSTDPSVFPSFWNPNLSTPLRFPQFLSLQPLIPFILNDEMNYSCGSRRFTFSPGRAGAGASRTRNGTHAMPFLQIHPTQISSTRRAGNNGKKRLRWTEVNWEVKTLFIISKLNLFAPFMEILFRVNQALL